MLLRAIMAGCNNVEQYCSNATVDKVGSKTSNPVILKTQNASCKNAIKSKNVCARESERER